MGENSFFLADWHGEVRNSSDGSRVLAQPFQNAVTGRPDASLVAKSLATFDGPTHAGRWRLLETVRAYALEKLAESGEAEQAARAHAAFFRDLLGGAGSSDHPQAARDHIARCVREMAATSRRLMKRVALVSP